MITVPQATGMYPDMGYEWSSVPEQRMDYDRACNQKIIRHPPVVVQVNISNGAAILFHVV
jgi:hypothetical protein